MTERPLVVFVAANEAGARTGNERTLCRLATRLDEAGVDVHVARPGDTADDVVGALSAEPRRPELVHAFHARRSGPRGVELSARLGVPLVVGLTGTDLVRDLFVEDRVDIVLDVLRHAASVTCGNPEEARTVARLLDDPPPCIVLPKGVHVPDRLPTPAPLRGEEELVVLQVAHVRPVKNVALAVRVVSRLADALPVRLIVLGDVLDGAYATRCADEAGGAEAWARILHPAVAPDDVGSFLLAADVVLNTSDGEGGSNAVLEAMAHGRAVVASAVPGNVVYLGDDASRGLTYPVHVDDHGAARHDEAALDSMLRGVLADADLRRRLGVAARAWVAAEQSPAAERAALLRAYAGVRPGSFRPR